MTLEEYNDLKSSITKTATNKVAEILLEVLEEFKPQQPKLERWKPHFNEPYWVISKRTDKIADQMAWSDHPIEIKEWENFQCFQTEQEAQQEALRTRARRKLEWMARELNKQATGQGLCQYTIAQHSNGEWLAYDAFRPYPINTVIFYNQSDAEYALSQMTSEELEALR